MGLIYIHLNEDNPKSIKIAEFDKKTSVQRFEKTLSPEGRYIKDAPTYADCLLQSLNYGVAVVDNPVPLKCCIVLRMPPNNSISIQMFVKHPKVVGVRYLP